MSILALVQGTCADVGARSAGRHVLAIQDTTEINYPAPARRVSGLRTVGNGPDVGFFLHPVRVVDAQERACLGLAPLHLWQRRQGKAANYRALPIEAKESYRWISAIEAGRERLAAAAKITVVADREADIFEMWSRLPNERTELLIRANRDRARCTDPGMRRFEWMGRQPVQGRYCVTLPKVAGKRSAHEAVLQGRFAPVTIKKPRHSSDATAPEKLTLQVIEVIEEAGTVVAGEAPIPWRLLTACRDDTGADPSMYRRVLPALAHRADVSHLEAPRAERGIELARNR